LTKLANREEILRSINDRIYQHRRKTDDTPFAVFFIDLNNFKFVNDRLGHDAGDKVLVEVGERLRLSIRSGDLVARYAGDEFVVLANDVGSVDNARKIRNSIEKVVGEPMKSVDTSSLAGIMLGAAVGMLGAAVGFAYYPSDATTAQQLIKQADTDMYARKHTSKARL